LSLASETRVDGVLMKPLDPNHLRTVVNNLLAGARTYAPVEKWRPRYGSRCRSASFPP
jgi:hypothetical protein